MARNLRDNYLKNKLPWTSDNEYQLKKHLDEVAEDVEALGTRLTTLETLVQKISGLVKATVTFDSKGGSAIEGSPFSIVFGHTVTKPDDPTKTGKTFAGWFKGEATTAYDFSTPVEEDFTLDAHWETAVLTVIFDSDGGSAIEGSPFSVEYGSTVARPEDPTKEGHTFVNWFEGASETAFDFTTTITSNKTLTAHWTEG